MLRKSFLLLKRRKIKRQIYVLVILKVADFKKRLVLKEKCFVSRQNPLVRLN